LVCDASSDFISRPVDVAKYGLIYAGAQKNAGPAGVTVVILRDDLLARVPENLPAMLDFKLQVTTGSMHNTPPCFSVYMVGLVLKWAKEIGGLSEIARRSREKADWIYKTIDNSGGFYRGHAKSDRSVMNVTFRLPSEDLENTFATEAKKQNLIGLKGHRSVGGLRASIYNAMTVEGVHVLVDFMKEFQRKNG
jgi:phosphoserine aminotransferase